jgi:hypothetical protein
MEITLTNNAQPSHKKVMGITWFKFLANWCGPLTCTCVKHESTKTLLLLFKSFSCLGEKKKKTRQKATPKARDEIKITHNLDKSRRYIRLGLKFVKKNPYIGWIVRLTRRRWVRAHWLGSSSNRRWDWANRYGWSAQRDSNYAKLCRHCQPGWVAQKRGSSPIVPSQTYHQTMKRLVPVKASRL